ncbi:MdtA/MuxA family multidrug efflux RND transporter periplasmic adaptor subunit [Rhodocyclus gracilis]|uniref:MdtA/MuxA family multidrug efflux RND transporter periplasmic adaptor subunit n=1 Tax=Rhodocyclus tenuis TaxID=1066 RepID=A0A6L5JV56_RHOTE|nr:MdtA/MuxA family multidrug efflux RND transporter periplasmic adaptor subunit [Rhodocyclus gracilis]
MKMKIVWVCVALLTGLAAFWLHGNSGPTPDEAAGPPGMKRGPGEGKPAPVQAARATSGDIDVYLNALGTVTARNTSTVKARVDGQLVRIAFREGQLVKAGETLAEIDPRPFQVVLDQANGQLLRDQALLANARLDLERYRGLLAKDSIAKQQVDAQESLVRQYEGTVLMDRAQVDSARLQLGFTRITAPVAGRLGLRQLDTGNMIHGSDTTGLVVITQTQPITVVFAIPAGDISAVLSRLHGDERLRVEAFDRDGKTLLATGNLLTLDNQIDTTTGTVKLKAEFANNDERLFPNQFVNARLRVETRHDAVLVPLSAIQRGTQGTFVYVLSKDRTVSLRPVTLGPVSGETVAIEKGLTAGEEVVTDGADKLREKAKVEVSTPGASANAAAEHGAQSAGGARRHKPQ